ASRARWLDVHRTRILIPLVVASLFASTPQLRGDTPVHFDVEMPTAPPAQVILWGLTQGGIELARGEQRIGDLNTGGTQVTFTARLDERAPQGDAPVLAHLCINRDTWNSYTASFGDTFAIAPLQAGEGRWTARVEKGQWQIRAPRDAQAVLTVHY